MLKGVTAKMQEAKLCFCHILDSEYFTNLTFDPFPD